MQALDQVVDVVRFRPKDALATENGLLRNCLDTIENALSSADPILNHLSHNPGRWARFVCEKLTMGRELWYAPQDGSCCAVGFFYPEDQPSFWQDLWNGGLWLVLRELKSVLLLPSFLAWDAKAEECQEKYAKELGGRFFYVLFMGTHSDVRGKGLGSALLRRMCADADAEGTPLYLEATSEANIRLYTRHGFVLAEEVHTQPLLARAPMPPMYCMYRKPQISTGAQPVP